MPIEGAYTGWKSAGPPSNGTDEVQTLTLSAAPAAGSFRLKFEGFETGPLAFDAPAAAMEGALEDLPSIGHGNVSVGLVGQVYTLTFGGVLAKLALSLVQVLDNTIEDALGDPVDIAVARSQAGVTATGRGAPKGALLLDTTNAKYYINGGSALEPSWRLVTSA